MNSVEDYRWNNVQGTQGNHGPASPRNFFKHRNTDKHFISVPSFLSRCTGRTDHSTAPNTPQLSKCPSRKSMHTIGPSTALNTPPLPKCPSRKSMDTAALPSLSRNASRRSSGPIMFSNSMGLLKPPATIKDLECTLDELCHGCIKKIKITRNVITNNGEEVHEEEVLTIKVKPGWTIGTKVTFEGMGDEMPGSLPGDVTFFLTEKRHPLFTREGEDLELAIEIPLVKALTGFNLSFPLLGGDRMALRIDEIIYPGTIKIIEGQGMPNPKEQGRRGNLRIKFLVRFPTELAEEQRSDIKSILQDSS